MSPLMLYPCRPTLPLKSSGAERAQNRRHVVSTLTQWEDRWRHLGAIDGDVFQ